MKPLILSIFALVASTSSPLASPQDKALPTEQSTLSEAFRFHEAYLLERHAWRAGEDYTGDPSSYLRQAPSPAEHYLANESDLNAYRVPPMMLELLSRIDQVRRRGGLAEAEVRYREFVSKVSLAQGDSATDVALALGHLGKFYLETRDFDQAYQAFTRATAIDRKNVDAGRHLGSASAACFLPTGECRTPADAASILVPRLHLADMLTELGKIDLARNHLENAGKLLTEAVQINEEPDLMGYDDRLEATYFASRVLEKQGKWLEAEKLWQDNAALRHAVASAPYIQSRFEMAAFYARHGAFHEGAEISRRLGQDLKAALQRSPNIEVDDAPYWTAPLEINNSFRFYEQLGKLTMLRIWAVDDWLSGKLQDANRLISILPQGHLADYGASSDRLKLLDWQEKSVFLDLSILLDGEPSPDHVAAAYKLWGGIKGQFLASYGAKVAYGQKMAAHPPGASGGPEQFAGILDDLTDAAETLGHDYALAALGGKPIDRERYASDQLSEATTEAAIAAAAQPWILAPSPPDLASIGNSLPAGAALIDIIDWNRLDRDHPSDSRREYGAFVIRSGQPVRYVRLAAPSNIDNDIDGLNRQMLAFQQSGSDELGDAQQLLRRLYRETLSPLDASLGEARRLLIIPDGKLALLPFGALVGTGGRYVLEDRTVTYLNSWRDLTMQRDKPLASQISPPLIVADPEFDLSIAKSVGAPSDLKRAQYLPLPASEQEADAVQSLLQVPPSRRLTGDQAREQLVKAIRGPQVLHFSTHSVIDLTLKEEKQFDSFEYPVLANPLLHSAILLAGANRPQRGIEDGILTGLEIASMPLAGTRLAVLSSCDSAAGEPVAGQGIMGLRAAFSIAGATSLVSNLWTEDDNAGPVLMRDFYSEVASSSSPTQTTETGFAEALRLAQIHMLSKTKYKNPYFWAGYVHSGNFSPWTTAQLIKPSREANELPFAPRCFQLSGHSFSASNARYRLRVKINTFRATERSEDAVVYDLHQPENEIQFDAPGASPIRSSLLNSATLTMKRPKDYSSLTIEVGKPARLSVTLKGSHSLFPSLDIPDALPPVDAYTVAGISSALTIDKISECAGTQ